MATTENLSSLEVLLLVLVREGTNTTYRLRRDIGLSFGTIVPALNRLSRQKLLSRTTVGKRARSEYRLTALGTRVIRDQSERLIKSATEDRGAVLDIQEAIRLIVLARSIRKSSAVRVILTRAARAREEEVKEGKPQVRKTGRGYESKSVDFLAYLSGLLRTKTAKAELEFISELKRKGRG